MNAKVKEIIEKHISDINNHNFNMTVQEAIKENVLDELLDVFYKSTISIPVETITKYLYEFYLENSPNPPDEKLTKKIRYMINKSQLLIFKTLCTNK